MSYTGFIIVSEQITSKLQHNGPFLGLFWRFGFISGPHLYNLFSNRKASTPKTGGPLMLWVHNLARVRACVVTETNTKTQTAINRYKPLFHNLPCQPVCNFQPLFTRYLHVICKWQVKFFQDSQFWFSAVISPLIGCGVGLSCRVLLSSPINAQL